MSIRQATRPEPEVEAAKEAFRLSLDAAAAAHKAAWMACWEHDHAEHLIDILADDAARGLGLYGYLCAMDAEVLARFAVLSTHPVMDEVGAG